MYVLTPLNLAVGALKFDAVQCRTCYGHRSEQNIFTNVKVRLQRFLKLCANGWHTAVERIEKNLQTTTNTKGDAEHIRYKGAQRWR